MTIAIAGASGYVGARLCPMLLEKGYRVRTISRSIAKLKNRPWANHPNVELHEANVLDPVSLEKALQGIDHLFYLVHSMDSERSFAEKDRQAAENIVKAAAVNRLKRIIYLGGLGDPNDTLSPHLRSRWEVGEILKKGPVPVTLLRAAVIIGAGSLSFEVLRYLVDRLPIMLTPKWVSTLNQPIAIRNVLNYLVGVLEHDETIGQTYDIGGTERLTYRELMAIYAKAAGLKKRLIIPVPVLTPRLSSLWIGLVTPVPPATARALLEGLSNTVLCQEERIKKIIPQELIPIAEAVKSAIHYTHLDAITSSWRDAGVIPPEIPMASDPYWAGGTRFDDTREKIISSSLQEVWSSISRLGGENGWYYANFLWKIRGLIDRLIGGPGLSRGRRSYQELRTGDTLDFWRVGYIEPLKKLLLIAEMKVPGVATLEYHLTPQTPTTTLVYQSAKFYPSGLWGILYWKAMLPFHYFIFRGMLRGIEMSSRKIERIACQTAVRVKINNDTILQAALIDISTYGCRLLFTNKVSPDSKVILEFPFAYANVTCEVRSINFIKGITYIGVRFFTPQPELAQLLTHAAH